MVSDPDVQTQLDIVTSRMVGNLCILQEIAAEIQTLLEAAIIPGIPTYVVSAVTQEARNKILDLLGLLDVARGEL